MCVWSANGTSHSPLCALKQLTLSHSHTPAMGWRLGLMHKHAARTCRFGTAAKVRSALEGSSRGSSTTCQPCQHCVRALIADPASSHATRRMSSLISLKSKLGSADVEQARQVASLSIAAWPRELSLAVSPGAKLWERPSQLHDVPSTANLCMQQPCRQPLPEPLTIRTTAPAGG